jgi:uncharacterized protein
VRLAESGLLLSATDLANHVGCRHRTLLDLLRAEGKLRPPRWENLGADVLRERGLAHERAYLEHLRAEGREVERFEEPALTEAGVARVLAAMRRGAGAIAQAPLVQGRWRGVADVLLRVEEASALGAWSYEPVDTKLAAETKGGTVLQLCLYAELLGALQGRLPDAMYVVKPGLYGEPERVRTRDYLAYYRRVRDGLAAALGAAGALEGTYPEPAAACDVCLWWERCDGRRRADDHLSLVAGVTRLQRGELAPCGIATLTALAKARLPLAPRPRRGAPEGYERAHHQARVQLASRGKPRPVVEPLPPAGPGLGLARLPEPCAGDVFLDLEGDPFVEGGGLEYLLGWVTADDGAEPAYTGWWALTRAEEKRAFEALIDALLERWERHPGLHVYHFGAYEPAALKRLMGRHATREEGLDRLLRGERFVDLHAVVRQSVRAGVEAYGLKQLEAVHGFARELDLRTASLHKHALECGLELGAAGSVRPEDRAAVEAYNRDDCVSTLRLRDWLERVRAERLAAGDDLPRPQPGAGDPPEALDERVQRVRALMARLAGDVPPEPAERSAEQHARWLLANLLEWHRREDKASWWEFFRLAALPKEELRDEKHGLVGLELVGTFGGTPKAPVHRYRFPPQDHDIRATQTLHVDAETELGRVEDVDLGACTVDVKKRTRTRDLHPDAAFAHEIVPARPIPDALEDLAGWVAEHGVDAGGPFRAARDLLLRRPPRLRTGAEPVPETGARDRPGDTAPLARPDESPLEAATRLALALDGGVLPIQGPPGTGKTWTGARVVCRLVQAGRKVGITATSHKVIRNLVDEVLAAAAELRVPLHVFQKADPEKYPERPGVSVRDDNDALDQALADGTAQVGAGTVWAWARAAAAETLDVLVVDEAGQLSLANAVAAAKAARNVLLLGDPQQLEQPMQGSHPDGCDASALDHLLEGRDTLEGHRGLFLAETWRLHPSICELTSELFYDARLRAHAGCEGQALRGPTRFAGAGLWLCPVDHDGNQTSSPEEVERVAALLEELTATGATWVNAKGEEQPLTLADVLVVSPYNAQVAALRTGLPGAAKVGTVDRFQGQEAAVVIYSMATSSADEAPRGLEFLFSLNRLNVATSRARCACILVASPRLLEADCHTPRQMRLANALCRYRELARVA